MVENKRIETRCLWVPPEDILYQEYHDHEWGRPVHDDVHLFELLILEGAQAGLSWITVLKRREDYRQAFSYFDPYQVAQYDEVKIAEILSTYHIIKNKLKVASTINNARQFLKVQNEFGSFNEYIWKFVDYKPLDSRRKTINEIPAQTELSLQISKDLKKRGFNFVGPTIMYAFMQAAGMVNDHTTDCFCYEQVKRLIE